MVAPFLEFTSIDHRKPLSGLIESYDEVVEHGRRITVSAASQSTSEATSVMEDIYVELELVRFEMRFDAFGQTRGRLVSAFLSLCDQRREKDGPIAIDQHDNSLFTSLDCLNGVEGRNNQYQPVAIR
jgi:hypothetical protein